MRSAGALALLLLAGCLSDDPVATGSVEIPDVAGLVLDPLLAPLANAQVTLLDNNLTVTTGPDGSFRFVDVPGVAALVHARADKFEPATRRATLDAGDAWIELVLAPLPVETPYTVESEHAGFVSCAGMVRVGGETSQGTVFSCGENDPNDQRELEYELPLSDGVAGVVLELVWEPGSGLASRFEFSLQVERDGQTTDLGRAEGESYVKIAVSREVARELLLPGAVLRTRTEPAPSLLDEEAFLGIGAAVAQPFSVIATVFYHAPPDPAYSALR